jgi:hypothetical protein
MMSGALGWKYRLWKDARLSSCLPDIDVDGTREGFWGCHRLSPLCLVAKLSHVGLMWMG